jgi:hypothetical protein
MYASCQPCTSERRIAMATRVLMLVRALRLAQEISSGGGSNFQVVSI